MRNEIQYYYNLEPVDIHQYNDYYYFKVKETYYRLINITGIDVAKVQQLHGTLYQSGVYTHQIIPTVENQLVMPYHEKIYVLLKLYNDMKEKISFQHILLFSNQTLFIPEVETLKSDNWGNLWSQKIDYFEYQMSQFGIKYPTIQRSFAYFVGLAEVGISLFHQYKQKDDRAYLVHKRMKYGQTMFDLYDPFNLTFDLRIRDSAEYFKSLFIEKQEIFDEIRLYLDSSNLTSYEKIMFFIRMLYPSFYFDLFERVMDQQEEDLGLKKIIKKSATYLDEIEKLYVYLSYQIAMPTIPWLKKM